MEGYTSRTKFTDTSAEDLKKTLYNIDPEVNLFSVFLFVN